MISMLPPQMAYVIDDVLQKIFCELGVVEQEILETFQHPAVCSIVYEAHIFSGKTRVQGEMLNDEKFHID